MPINYNQYVKMSFLIAQYLIYFFIVMFTAASLFMLLAPQKFIKKKELTEKAVHVVVSYMGTVIVLVLSGLIYYVLTQQSIGLLLAVYTFLVNTVFKSVHGLITGKVAKDDIVHGWIVVIIISLVTGLALGYLSF